MRNLVAVIACAMLFACADESGEHPLSSGPIRVAVLPDQAADTLISQHTPLLDYLEQTTSLTFELVIPDNYEDLLEQFDAGGVDLAWFGGLTYVRAERQSGAVPLAFRDVDLQFTSCYLSSASDARSSIVEFEGEEFSFGPQLSTSGHLMPRYFLEKKGQHPEQFFAGVRHSAAHDQTAEWVAEGNVAIGVANCVIVQSLLESGRVSGDDVKIIETTPPYSDYVWATHPSLNQRVRNLLLDALLSLDATVPEHREILRSQGANSYFPAGRGNFSMIRTAAERAGLLAGDQDN